MSAPLPLSSTPSLEIPAIAELAKLRQWVAWKRVSAKPKDKKIPVNPHTGGNASVKASATWGTFDEAVARCQKDKLAGVGFVFTKGDAYVGIDLDNCLDPVTCTATEWARGVMGGLATYCERSPSGKGLKLIAVGDVPSALKLSHLEIYDDKRFFTLTGVQFPNTPDSIEQRSAEVLKLYRQYETQRKGTVRKGDEQRKASSSKGNSQAERGRTVPLTKSDKHLLAKARGAANGEKFSDLYDDGAWEQWYPEAAAQNAGQSDADAGLCELIAYHWGDDAEAIDRVFRNSALFRKKWDERRGPTTYGERTIAFVLKQRQERNDMRADAHTDGRRAIVGTGRQLREMVREALEALNETNDPPTLYTQAGGLVRVRVNDHGHPYTERLTEAALRSRLSEAADWYSSGSPEKRKPIVPPDAIVKAIIASDVVPFPALLGITEVPTLRADGSILDMAGYDSATKLVYAPANCLVLTAIPEHPSAADIASARALLCEVICDFPFVTDADRTTMLALMTTAVLRPAIAGPTPMFLLDKPTPGSGGSLLAETIAIIATGEGGAFTPAPTEEAEWEKQLLSLLVEGARLVIFDNLDRVLKSGKLAQVLTETQHRGRILGQTGTATVPQRAVWIATGNNIQVGGDLPRRCVRCRVDARVERPETREGFKHDPLLPWVAEQRGAIIAAVLTLARAWVEAGRPHNTEARRMGSFEDWAQVVGGTLEVAGVHGFLGGQAEFYAEANTEGPEWTVFLSALVEAYGEGVHFMAAEVADSAMKNLGFGLPLPTELQAAKLDGAEKLARKLGEAFGKRVGRPYGAYKLERGTALHNSARWVLRPVAGAASAQMEEAA